MIDRIERESSSEAPSWIVRHEQGIDDRGGYGGDMDPRSAIVKQEDERVAAIRRRKSQA